MTFIDSLFLRLHFLRCLTELSCISTELEEIVNQKWSTLHVLQNEKLYSRSIERLLNDVALSLFGSTICEHLLTRLSTNT